MSQTSSAQGSLSLLRQPAEAKMAGKRITALMGAANSQANVEGGTTGNMTNI